MALQRGLLLADLPAAYGLRSAARYSLLSAMVAERNNALRTLEQACAALAEVVAHLAPGEAGEPWPPSEPGDPGSERFG